MRKLLCRLLGHNTRADGTRHRWCQRCGLKEALRRYGNVLAWEEVNEQPLGGVAA
jgi:hypothetical protein